MHARIATVVLLSTLTFAQAAPKKSAALTPEQRTAKYFESIKNDPVKLRAFLRAFPKGGDLHNHHHAAGETAISPDTVADLTVRWTVQTTGNVSAIPALTSTREASAYRRRLRASGARAFIAKADLTGERLAALSCGRD